MFAEDEDGQQYIAVGNEVEEDCDEARPRKPRKKKHIKRLKTPEIVPVVNQDKKHVERWDPKRAKDLANIPSPARILLLGPCNVGKSTVIKNLIMRQWPRFKKVYLIHEDAHNTREYDDMDFTERFDEVPSIEFWDTGDEKYEKRAVVVDDLEMVASNKERLKNLAILFRYASSHKGLTVYLAHQSFFDIMPLIKKMANFYILWKPRSRGEIELIENRTGLAKGCLKELFATVATGHRDSICVDLTENSPAKLRLNLFKKINIASSDEEEED